MFGMHDDQDFVAGAYGTGAYGETGQPYGSGEVDYEQPLHYQTVSGPYMSNVVGKGLLRSHRNEMPPGVHSDRILTGRDNKLLYNDGLYTSSAIMNSQLVPIARNNLYYPTAVTAVIQGVPASPPMSPPGYTQQTESAYEVIPEPTMYVSSDPGWVFETVHTPIGVFPKVLHPMHSPIPWLIALFIVGAIMLSWLKPRKESK